MLNIVQTQIKEIEKLRALKQNIDPVAQQQHANLNEMQNQLALLTQQTVQQLGYHENLLQNRNFATSCTDEISLLTQIAKTEFQVEPTPHEDELNDNVEARFKTTICFGEKEVGYAVGPNKKKSKLNACKHILQAMVPHLYKDWLREQQHPSARAPGAFADVGEQNPRPQSPSLDNMMNVEENPELGEDDCLQKTFNALSLDQIIKMTNQSKTPEELRLDYTEMQLEDFREKRDAPIDDKNILDSKELNHLTSTHKPMALMNTLKQKETGVFEIEERSVQRQDPVFGAGAHSSLWYTDILINKSRVGEGISQNKKMSAHYAALDMFKNIFPRGTTWNMVKEFIAQKKKPLQELQRMKDAVQI